MESKLYTYQPLRPLPDPRWSKPCSRAIAGSCVKGCAKEGDIKGFIRGGEAWPVGDAAKSGDSGEDAVGLGAAVTRKGIIPKLFMRTLGGKMNLGAGYEMCIHRC